MSKGLPGGLTSPGAGFTRPTDAFSVGNAGAHGYRACFVRSSGSCNIRLTVGTLDGGEASILFTLTPRGAWLSASGWNSARLEIVSCDTALHRLSWLFSTELPPQSPERLTLIQAIAAVPTDVPAGAVAVTLDLADANFAWATNPDGAGAVTFNQSIAADTRVDVLGGAYLPSGANRAVWWLDPL